jgi:hypothetical protein
MYLGQAQPGGRFKPMGNRPRVTFGKLGAYIQSGFPLPTVSAVQGNYLYVPPMNPGPIAPVPAAAPVKKKSCKSCGGGIRGNRARRNVGTSVSRTLGRLGQDDSLPTFDPYTLDTENETPVLPSSITDSGDVFGPTPTLSTLNLNASQGLGPGTSGWPSWVTSLLSSAAGTGVSAALAPGQTAAQQQAASTAANSIGGIPISTILLYGGVGFAGLLLLSALSGKRR